MSEVTSRVRSGITARVGSVRDFVTTEVGLGKSLINDIVERVNLNDTVEPTFARGANGGVFGQKGNVVKSVVAFVSGTSDNLSKLSQDMAQQNRRLLHR